MEKKHISAYQNAGLKKNRLTKRTGQARVSAYVRDDKSDKNRGGILGGAGYIAGSLGLGAVGVAEGIGDLVSAGADLIRGDTDMAKYRFLDNQTGEAQQRLLERYNPGTIMKGAGDVASGVGNSLVFMIPYAGPYLAGAGYVGMGISSAAEQTGDVGLKEIGYGTVTGASEFLMDKLFGGAGQAAKNIGASITRKVGREAAESGAKATAKLAGKSFGKSVLKETLTGAAGEAAEEAVQEGIDPFLLKLFNIDENAEFSWGNVAYAGLIGGLSGGLMTAGPAAINYKSASKAGKAIRESGETEDFLRYTEQVLSGAERKIGKYQAEREADVSDGGAAGALGKVKSAVGGTVSSIRSKRAEKRITDMAKKVGDNLDTYKQYLNKADKTAKELEISDAVLGELRGNVFLLENASLLESYEEAIISEDETVKQALVDDFNRRAKEGGGEKFDYTVADLEANADDMLTAIAGRYMMEDAYGPYMKRSERSKRQENASDSAEVAREGAKEAGEEQTDVRDETGDTGALDGSEAGSWDAVTNESAKVYGAQTPDEKALLDAAVSEGIPEKSIPAMLDRFRAGTSLTPQEFAEGWTDGVMLFGKYNVDEGGIDPESALGRMEESSRRAAIQYGRAEAEAERGKDIQRAEARKKAAAEKGDGKKAVRHTGINLKSDLNDAQFSAYKAAEIMASAIHADIEIRKNLTRDGKRINGYYDPDTNTLVINISAMRDGRHIALYTLGHEVTHYIRQWSPEKFYEMGDFVTKKLGDGAEKAIREKLSFMEESGLLQGKTASEAYELAYEEVVAEGMEGVLADGVVLEELSRADKTLWEKIKDRITQIIGKVKKAYGELKGTSRTAQILSETMDSMEELERLFIEGVSDAGDLGNTGKTDSDVRYSMDEEGGEIQDVSEIVNEYTRLADAFEDSVVSEQEYKIIKQYRERAYAMEQADQRLKALRREAASINREIEALAERIRGVEKSQRDAWVVTALDEAKKRKSSILEEMNKISKSLREDMDRLLSLQAADPIRRAFGEEKKRADAMERKAERAELRTEEKNRQYKEKVDRMMEESAERGEITTRKRTVMRVLGSLQTKLYHPTKTNHVPKELHDLAMKTLEAADPGAFGKNRNNIKELGELAAKIERLEKKAARTALEQKNLDDWKYRYERLSEETISLRKQAEAMLTAFVEYNKQAPEALRYPDPIIELMTDEVKKIEQVPMYQMGLESLKAVETFVTMVNHHVTKANELFAAEREKTVSDAGDAAIQETLSHKALKFLSPKAMELKGLDRIRRFFWKNMKPLTVFEAIGSDTFTELFQRVIDSEAVWAQDILEARGQILAAREKFGYDSWDLKERRAVETKSGTVELSLSEIMSLYAYSFREQALSHLEGGGFVLDPNATATVKGKTLTFAQVERRLNNSQRYVMDAQEMGNLASLLTEQQKSYVQQMQQYLTSLGEKGNTVSRKLYGIDLFTEKYYFPIKVKSEYLQSQTGPSGDQNIKSRGHTKQVVPNADNPLVLQDFDQVVSDHINSMATYHAFVLPIEDLTRVLNYKPSNVKIDDDGNWIEDDTPKDYSTLKAVIESKYGEQANAYIVQLIRDLNGGARRDAAAGLLDRGITAFKRASTMLSMSVTIQQPTSLVRAMAYIDPRYFANLSGLDFKNHKELWEIVKKYAPVAIIKEMGGYDTGVGTRTGDYLNAAEYKTFGEKFSAFIKPERFGGDANYRSEVFGAAAAYADEMAWIQIFEACVNEQADMMKKPHDSEEVLRAAGKRFEEVIRRTQVYDSTLTRSEYMRSKDTGMKMATAFMAEPTTVSSMVADALIRAERGDKKFLRRTAGAIGGAILANSLLVSLVYALRDDDEDETYTEKYLSSLASELTEGINPAGYLPVFRDIMSIMQGYEVERSDMTLIQNLYDQIQNITSSKRSVADKMFGVSGAVSAFFGVPVSNVYRDAKGIMNTFIGQVDTETTTGKGVSKALKEEFTTIFGLFDKQTTNQYQLYQAAVSGDNKHFNRVAARYESEKDVEMALRKAIRENDRRIAEAARARIDGELDIYKSMIEQIEGEGHFDRDIIIRAINNEMTAIKREEEAGKTVPRDEDADAADEYESESIFTSSDLNDALERGDREDFLDVYATLLAYRKEQGKTEEQAKAAIKSSVTSYWKKKYIAAWEANDQAEIKRILSILLASGLYGSGNDVAETGQGWVKDYAKSKIQK